MIITKLQSASMHLFVRLIRGDQWRRRAFSDMTFKNTKPKRNKENNEDDTKENNSTCIYGGELAKIYLQKNVFYRTFWPVIKFIVESGFKRSDVTNEKIETLSTRRKTRTARSRTIEQKKDNAKACFD
ncbi:hypothetical protein T4D_11679 [Trichinella pseudospiralis]|uniref:Uncharacterized protein n=1 Tax=Trichinella pseudospiralis TaxID=6337 RepID=A0A0V1F574_TRIPS|nr:hypothetical protein T4D_16154 [Trichinella pseudospiralis]KRY90119.1 hypothetical protein T4D_11679 [Trichinella pseudospiralis]